MLDLNNYSYIMLNLDWSQQKMQEKYFFQTVPEHEKHRLSRAFVDVASLCSRVEPQKEREKLSLVQVCVCVWPCLSLRSNQQPVPGQRST